MRPAIAIVVAALVLAPNLPARADTRVTQCGNDGELAAAVRSGGTVTFDCGEATIQMSQPIPVSANVVIDGGLKVTLLQGSGPMFTAQRQGALLTLKNLKFRDTQNAMVQNTAQAGLVVSVTGSTFTNCEAPFRNQNDDLTIQETVFTNCKGNVVHAAGPLTIERSRFEGTNGTAVFSFGPDTTTRIVDSTFIGSSDAALLLGTSSAGDANQTIEIVRSTFSNNGVPAAGQTSRGTGAVSLGCASAAKQCVISVTNSSFLNNQASQTDGGALSIRGATSVTLKGSKFEGNTVQSNNGGALFYDPGSAPNPKLDMQFTVFRSNRARFGGAVSVVTAQVVGQSVTFAKNEASDGGGGLHATDSAVDFNGGVFVENAARFGSAISLGRAKPSTLANTLIVRNRAVGAAFIGDNTRFVNATVVDNSGIGIEMSATTGTSRPISLRNSIVASNSRQNCTPAARSGSASPFVDEGNNIEFPGSTCSPTMTVAKPNLDSLYLPVMGSPAINHGDNTVCLGPPVFARDVYGKRRPQGGFCSIGAVEGDLTKEIADRTVGGLAWPPNKNSPRPQDGGAGDTDRRVPEPSNCCCCGR